MEKTVKSFEGTDTSPPSTCVSVVSANIAHRCLTQPPATIRAAQGNSCSFSLSHSSVALWSQMDRYRRCRYILWSHCAARTCLKTINYWNNLTKGHGTAPIAGGFQDTAGQGTRESHLGSPFPRKVGPDHLFWGHFQPELLRFYD